MSLEWVGANRIIGTVAQLFAALTMNANSLLGRANVAAGAPEQIAVADNSIVGRNGGVVGGIAMAVQTILVRAAGNVVAQAIATNEIVGRAGGNLGPIAMAVQTVLVRAGGDIAAQAIATNEVIGRAAADVAAIPVGNGQALARPAGGDLQGVAMGAPAIANTIVIRDAAGRASFVDPAADFDAAIRRTVETTRNGGIATAIWYLALQAAPGQTIVIGADTYEWDGAGVNINIAIGLNQAADVATLAAAINSAAGGATEFVRGDVAVIGGIQAVIVQSADAVGGTATPANPDILLGETCAGAGNEWDCGNVNLNTLSGEAYAYNLWGQIELPITAPMLTAAAGVFSVGTVTFTPRIWTVQCLTGAGIFREIGDTFALQGNTVICTFGGVAPLIATDTVIVTAMA